MRARETLQDVAGLDGPNEGFWVLVMAVNIVADGHNELFKVAEDAALDAVFGQISLLFAPKSKRLGDRNRQRSLQLLQSCTGVRYFPRTQFRGLPAHRL